MTKQVNPTYLGDAVYASFDGYNICLHLESHTKPVLIAMEPNVLAALNAYAKLINETFNVEHF